LGRAPLRLLDVVGPARVRVQGVDREADQLDAATLELRFERLQRGNSGKE